MANKNTNRRSRNWCAVVYPDSAPDNWKEILDSLNVKWTCSPLHDKDVDDDGQLKKAHWHIVVCFSGNKSFEQVVEDVTEPLHCPIPQICRDVRSSVRYFIHKDHPHKFQYDKKDIETYGGFDIGDVFSFSKSEKLDLLKEVIEFIRDEDIIEYYELVNYAMLERPDDWFPLITEGYTIMIREYINSNRHRTRFDVSTGEILESKLSKKEDEHGKNERY